MKSFNFKYLRIHFWTTPIIDFDIIISLKHKYIELSLFKWCIEIDW